MSKLEAIDTADLSRLFADMANADGGDGAMNVEARDALHGLATIYLRHRSADRALVMALLALHLGDPTEPLLMATALIMLRLDQAEQALAAIDRVERDFGKSRESGVLRARAITRIDGLAAGRAAMRDALQSTSPRPVEAVMEDVA